VQLPPADELETKARGLMAGWGAACEPLSVVWNRRLRTSAGRALPRKGRIELNPDLLAKAPERIEAILAHEAAHLAAYRLHGPRIRPHGREWAELLRSAGHPPHVTHDLPVDPQKRRTRRGRWLYLRLCDACGARRIERSVRYEPCHKCSADGRFLVLRASAGPVGWATLRTMSWSAVRQRCTMARR